MPPPLPVPKKRPAAAPRAPPAKRERKSSSKKRKAEGEDRCPPSPHQQQLETGHVPYTRDRAADFVILCTVG